MILIVEDNPVDARIIENIISHHYPKCDIITKTSAEEALLLCGEEPPPDLIVTDLHLEGSSGYDLCLELKAKGSPCCNIPIMMVSADPNKALAAARSLSFGAFAFEAKPIARKSFVHTLELGLAWGAAKKERIEIHAMREVAYAR